MHDEAAHGAKFTSACRLCFFNSCVRFLEPEHEMERTYKVKQKDLVKKVDVGSATKVSGDFGTVPVQCD